MSAQPPHARATEIGRICRRDVVTIAPGVDIAEAARLMRTSHIGFLIVCEPVAGGAVQAGAATGAAAAEKPRLKVIGVLTDRDIVVAVIAREANPHSLKVVDVMTRNPLLVAEDCSLSAALGFMRDTGVRRVPVVGAQDELVGVLSLDDVVESMARQLTSVAAAFRGEQHAERMARP